MGHDTYNRVWETDRKHPRKLLLLAIARYADARGVAWPKVETIARMMTLEGDTYVRGLIAEAIDAGDLIAKPGGGRGVPSIYGVAADLDAKQRRELCRVVQATEVRKGVRYLWIGEEREAWSEEAEARLLALPEPQPEAPIPSAVVEGIGERGTAVESPARRKSAGPPRHVVFLREHQMGAAHLFTDCDPDATIADYTARRAAGWTNGAIVEHWKQLPPRPDRIFKPEEDTSGKDQANRPAKSSGKPKPGDRNYYRRS